MENTHKDAHEIHLTAGTSFSYLFCLILGHLSKLFEYLCIGGRKDWHSLGSRILAVSTDLRCLASGFTALVFLDDMFVLTEVL